MHRTIQGTKCPTQWTNELHMTVI